nr:hypothetical protein CFP56_09231 [Quercus suber]
MFKDGLEMLEQRLRERYYTSVSDFSRDFSLEIGKVLATSANLSETDDIQAINSHLMEAKPGTAEHLALTVEQKEVKKLAKRLVKAVNDPMMEALRKEADLRGQAHEEELRKLDSMGIFASSKAMEADEVEDIKGTRQIRSISDASTIARQPIVVNGTHDDVDRDLDQHTDEAVIHLNVAGRDGTIPIPREKLSPSSKAVSHSPSSHELTAESLDEKPTEPLSPPISTNRHTPYDPVNVPADPSDVLANGGVPWYLEPFDISGTTVHEERYTGRAVLRDMSEELSDMDEDTLTELAPLNAEATSDGKPEATKDDAEIPEPIKKPRRAVAASAKRKRKRF